MVESWLTLLSFFIASLVTLTVTFVRIIRSYRRVSKDLFRNFIQKQISNAKSKVLLNLKSRTYLKTSEYWIFSPAITLLIVSNRRIRSGNIFLTTGSRDSCKGRVILFFSFHFVSIRQAEFDPSYDPSLSLFVAKPWRFDDWMFVIRIQRPRLLKVPFIVFTFFAIKFWVFDNTE